MSQTANKMATRPMFPLLMCMALPPMLSMLLSSLYNIVDSMFVARYSADALTAVSLAFRCRIRAGSLGRFRRRHQQLHRPQLGRGTGMPQTVPSSMG